MWVSDRWTDYELIDCGRGEKLERWGTSCWCGQTPRPSGTRPGPIGAGSIPTGGMPAPPPAGAVGEEGHAGALDHPLRQPHLQHQAHEFQAHRPLPGAGGQLGLCPRADPAGGTAHPGAQSVRLHRRSHGGLRRRRGQRVPCRRRPGHGVPGPGECQELWTGGRSYPLDRG